VPFLKNFVARGSQGFVSQSSPNVAHIAEQPPVLNKVFFSELQYSADVLISGSASNMGW